MSKIRAQCQAKLAIRPGTTRVCALEDRVPRDISGGHRARSQNQRLIAVCNRTWTASFADRFVERGTSSMLRIVFFAGPEHGRDAGPFLPELRSNSELKGKPGSFGMSRR